MTALAHPTFQILRVDHKKDFAPMTLLTGSLQIRLFASLRHQVFISWIGESPFDELFGAETVLLDPIARQFARFDSGNGFVLDPRLLDRPDGRMGESIGGRSPRYGDGSLMDSGFVHP